MNKKTERYPKTCVKQYEDGWYITHQALNGIRRKISGPYKTKAMAEPDRETLNNRYINSPITKQYE